MCVKTEVFLVQVLEARIDHSRVVSILRKADHLPLVKDYLIAVQKGNLAAVNDAVNELLIEEEDFKVLLGIMHYVVPACTNAESVTCLSECTSWRVSLLAWRCCDHNGRVWLRHRKFHYKVILSVYNCISWKYCLCFVSHRQHLCAL